MTGLYLYGDSQPFPGGYDVLTELRLFVQASSRALVCSHEAELLEESLGERAQGHLHAIEALQGFFDSLIEVVGDRAARSGVPQLVGPYAQEILANIERVGAEARAMRAKDLDADQVDVTSQIRDRRSELRKVLSEYLLNDPLPIESWAMSLSLSGGAPQGQIVMAHPGDLTTSFGIDVAGDGTWGTPRKVSELVTGMALQVGYKKAFLRSSMHPVIATLDDLVIGAVELGPDSFEVRLRKRPDSPRDSFVLTRDIDPSGQWIAKVHNIEGEGDAPFTSRDDDATRMRELGTALRRQCKPLLNRKRRLIYAQLDGHDVFDRGLVRALFERIVDRLEPIVSEVSRHSPNQAELSLKLERENGRREELYLRKNELIEMVSQLPEEQRGLFYRLSFMPDRPLPPPSNPPSAPPPPKHRL